jgi:geranylgeranyl reductase family protein
LQARHCDVLVIGAGPAGAAAAITLASRGIDLVLVDQADFPRDKACGDALIPDAMAALGRLGVLPAVRARAAPTEGIQVFAPDGSDLMLDGRVMCLPRVDLDEMLLDRARRAGARWMAPLRLMSLIDEAGQVRGARLAGDQGAVDIRARFTLLATGAAAAPLEMAGLCRRRFASGFAMRQYVRNPRLAQRFKTLIISYDQRMRPGYGWIFPGPDGHFNVGAGVFIDGRSAERGDNVRRVFERFVAGFPPARELFASGQAVGPLKGAPLRTALSGSHFGRPGVLAIGEAIGATYSFSGEGIGKALETGVLAAELVADRLNGGARLPGLETDYAGRLERTYRSRFRAYETAQRWLGVPAFCNLLARRARANERLRSHLEDVIDETSDPYELFSMAGLLKLFAPWGYRG